MENLYNAAKYTFTLIKQNQNNIQLKLNKMKIKIKMKSFSRWQLIVFVIFLNIVLVISAPRKNHSKSEPTWPDLKHHDIWSSVDSPSEEIRENSFENFVSYGDNNNIDIMSNNLGADRFASGNFSWSNLANIKPVYNKARKSKGNY